MATQDGAVRTEAEKGTGSAQDAAMRTEAEKDAPAGVSIPIVMYYYMQQSKK